MQWLYKAWGASVMNMCGKTNFAINLPTDLLVFVYALVTTIVPTLWHQATDDMVNAYYIPFQLACSLDSRP